MAEGYGVEMWCLDEIVTGRFAAGVTVLAQACYGRLSTSRGTLQGGEEESAYGQDLSEYVGAVGYDTAVNALPSVARGELLKDDRISDVEGSASIVETDDLPGGRAIILELDVVGRDETETFSLTLAVTDVTVTLIGGVQ